MRGKSVCMARLPRMSLPGVPQHVVQRGNNRLPCFLDDGDRRRYLQLLRNALSHEGCLLHAYVLMDNHVHLLLTPAATDSIARLMQRLGRNYVGLFNARHGRTGTLWEGRYKACPVDSEDYVLRCCRYIELNLVRAAIVDDPAAYRWSSCRANLGLRLHSGLSPPPVLLALGDTQAARAQAWQALLHEPLALAEVEAIRLYLQQQRALGTSAFQTMVQARTRRFAGTQPAHRPHKATETDGTA